MHSGKKSVGRPGVPPEPGDDGGEIVALGTPEDIAADPASWTGRYLKDILHRHGKRCEARRNPA